MLKKCFRSEKHYLKLLFDDIQLSHAKFHSSNPNRSRNSLALMQENFHDKVFYNQKMLFLAIYSSI